MYRKLLIRTSDCQIHYDVKYVTSHSLYVFPNQFFPKAGPTRGGTTLVISGTNLGASSDDIVNVTINDVGCKNISHNPGIS